MVYQHTEQIAKQIVLLSSWHFHKRKEGLVECHPSSPEGMKKETIQVRTFWNIQNRSGAKSVQSEAAPKSIPLKSREGGRGRLAGAQDALFY